LFVGITGNERGWGWMGRCKVVMTGGFIICVGEDKIWRDVARVLGDGCNGMDDAFLLLESSKLAVLCF
jgi:hypothetical protein